MDEHHHEQAAQYAEQLRADGEAEIRRALGPESHPDFDGRHCVESDGGEPIPVPRLNLGRIRCRDCQERIERRRARGCRI